MSKLDTLVADIYESLEGLSNGKPLEISEEELDHVATNIKEAIRHWATPRSRDVDFTLRMSNIGKPLRQLWYDKRSDSQGGTPNGATQIKFLYGHLLEEIVLMLVRIAGHTVTDEQKEVNVNGIMGHMDCKIDGEVVDVKTASNFAFNKFKKGTLAEDDPFGYLSQIAGYEHAEGTDDGGFLVINKESGELCFYQPDDLDKPNIPERINAINLALSVDNPPELCYPLQPHGKKGNMKIHKSCSWCAYKRECYPDLRVFKYSNGPVYLAVVEDEPNVEEVL